jgi:four helix bundle protein
LKEILLIINTEEKMSELAEALKRRTKRFAIAIIKWTQLFPKSEESIIIKRQIIRSATSVASNYRAACRARSEKEFLSKLATVVEEADETLFWLEIATESGIVPEEKSKEYINEATEILKIVSRSRKTLKDRINGTSELKSKNQKSTTQKKWNFFTTY